MQDFETFAREIVEKIRSGVPLDFSPEVMRAAEESCKRRVLDETDWVRQLAELLAQIQDR